MYNIKLLNYFLKKVYKYNILIKSFAVWSSCSFAVWTINWLQMPILSNKNIKWLKYFLGQFYDEKKLKDYQLSNNPNICVDCFLESNVDCLRKMGLKFSKVRMIIK